MKVVFVMELTNNNLAAFFTAENLEDFFMHMADALISPAVGGVMWAVSAGALAYSANKLNKENIIETKKMPLMGIAGAFVFAAQMINFTIPMTGSSGHLGGGLLLAALLGSNAGFLVISVVLTIQALFFADGGLVALGCNIFNMGFLACYVAYPYIFKPIIASGINKKSLTIASIAGAVVSLLTGSFGVVLQTLMSGITELPFKAFAGLMLPIHLAIGAVEGIITAAVLIFINSEQPELLSRRPASGSMKRIIIVMLTVTVFCSGILSWFASSNPDGLEWSVFNTAKTEEVGAVFEPAERLQESTSFMPDYGFKDAEESNIGTTAAGLIGSTMVLLISCFIGFLSLRFRKRCNTNE